MIAQAHYKPQEYLVGGRDPSLCTGARIVYDLAGDFDKLCFLKRRKNGPKVLVDALPFQHDVELHRPSLVSGHVRNPGGKLIPGAIVSFYSSQLSEGDGPLLVARVQTNEHGEYVAPIPNL